MLKFLAALLITASVASADISREKTIETAKQIDSLVNQKLEGLKITPNNLISDEVFLRRAYVDIIGRIPTAKETSEYFKNNSKTKKYDLIDNLVKSEGFVNNNFNFWADLLRIKTRLTNNVSGKPYIDFVKDFIRNDKPYDKFVYSLLTAKGRIFDDPAAGYFLRDTGMPLDNLSNTTQIFLGTSITCAQCHDHPFERWTQLEFYQLAAYTYGLDYRVKNNINQREVYALGREQKLSQREDSILRNILRVNSYGIDDSKKTLKLPDDYKYDDAKPGQAVKPATIYGTQPNEGDREHFAKWLTDPKNPNFAANVANRLWKKVFFMGVTEPVESINEKSKPCNPDLMKYLTEFMVNNNFSVRDYLKVLYYTDAYSREVSKKDPSADDVYLFQYRPLKRMSAEQIWDSFVTLVNPDPDHFYPTTDNSQDAIDIAGKSPSQIVDMVKDLASGKSGKKGVSKKGMTQVIGNPYVRAANLPSPMPADHFLREFGQSDREAIDAGSRDPSITQVLRMLNGDVDKVLLNKNSFMMKALENFKGNEKTAYIFYAILNRKPTQQEFQMFGIVQDSIWVLVNSREFIFIK